MWKILIAMPALISPALAQQLPDAAKLAPIYEQQRNAEANGRAECYAIMTDLQARVAELEKELAQAKAPPPQ
jgi:hypothetical protein